MEPRDNRQQQAIERVRLELVTRKFMVMVLALIGVWTGIAMILAGAPDFIESWFSPWSRYWVGGIALVGGLVTTIGGTVGDQGRKGWWTQVIGLVMMTCWYAGMGIAYARQAYWVQGIEIVGPGEPLGPVSTGRGYVPLVYLGLMIMTATPLATMIRLKQPASGTADA